MSHTTQCEFSEINAIMVKITHTKKEKKFNAKRQPSSVKKPMPMDSMKYFRLALLTSPNMTLAMWEKPKWMYRVKLNHALKTSMAQDGWDQFYFGKHGWFSFAISPCSQQSISKVSRHVLGGPYMITTSCTPKKPNKQSASYSMATHLHPIAFHHRSLLLWGSRWPRAKASANCRSPFVETSFLWSLRTLC